MSQYTRIPHFPQDLDNYAPWVATYGLLEPYGYCQCGCGQKTKIATRNDTERKWRKGHPIKMICGHSNRSGTLEMAFWKYVIPTTPIECWGWQGYFYKATGYGKGRFQDREFAAHRVSYELHYGPIPPGMFVCHTCDNKRCVNPHHLWLGTCQDNVDDMVAKQRQKMGSRHNRAIYTEQQIVRMRQMCRDGHTIRQIATAMAANYYTVYSIIKYPNKAWKHVR